MVEPVEVLHLYINETLSGEVGRNCSQLNVVPEYSSTVELETGYSPTSAHEEPYRIIKVHRPQLSLDPGETVLKGEM